ncbi:hypothetical protein Tco_1535692, partial [Tanacetum coccineum]
MTITRSGMTPKAIEELINQQVVDCAAELVVKSQNQNGDYGDKGNDGGNGNGNGVGNG